MTIDTREGQLFLDPEDPSVSDQLLLLSETQAIEARKMLRETITPQVVTEALCGSFSERRELREDTTILIGEVASAETLVARAKKEQHDTIKELCFTGIKQRFETARIKRAA